MPRTAQFDRRALAGLAARQHGVIARDQALECGMTHRVMYYRVRAAGPWQLLLPGVFLTHTGKPDDEARQIAALLYAGPSSVLTGLAALRRHGLTAGPAVREASDRLSLVDVLVPVANRRADAGFARLHRTRRLPAGFCVAEAARFAFPPRAVADAVRLMPDMSDVRAVVAEAVQRGRCSISHLAEELANGPIRDSALLREALAEVAEGVRSAAEADLRALILRARLPTPMFNPRLIVDGEFLAKPDCWWPESGVAGEADSRAWHFSPDDWEQTMARHARMSARGIIVLHFPPRQIRYQRDQVASMIRRALAAGRELPHIRAVSSAQPLPRAARSPRL
jgi:hypothetical protein